MWKLFLYVCTNLMVCKRQCASQSGTEIVWNIRKTASASGEWSPPDAIPGLCPWSLLGDLRPTDPLHVSSSCAPILNRAHPPNKSWRRPPTRSPRLQCDEITVWRVHFILWQSLWRVHCDEFTVWWKSELVTCDEFSVWPVYCKPSWPPFQPFY